MITIILTFQLKAWFDDVLYWLNIKVACKPFLFFLSIAPLSSSTERQLHQWYREERPSDFPTFLSGKRPDWHGKEPGHGYPLCQFWWVGSNLEAGKYSIQSVWWKKTSIKKSNVEYKGKIRFKVCCPIHKRLAVQIYLFIYLFLISTHLLY